MMITQWHNHLAVQAIIDLFDLNPSAGGALMGVLLGLEHRNTGTLSRQRIFKTVFYMSGYINSNVFGGRHREQLLLNWPPPPSPHTHTHTDRRTDRHTHRHHRTPQHQRAQHWDVGLRSNARSCCTCLHNLNRHRFPCVRAYVCACVCVCARACVCLGERDNEETDALTQTDGQTETNTRSVPLSLSSVLP